MTGRQTPEVLAELRRPLERAGLTAMGLAGLGAVGFSLAIPAWLLRLGVVRSPLWVVTAWVAAVAAAAFAGWLAARARRALAPVRLARAVEASPGWRQGSVTGLLEEPSRGTSESLYRAADEACAAMLRARGPAALEPVSARWRRTRQRGAIAAAAAVVLLGAARPFAGVVAQLWSPADAWAAFRAPVQLLADRGTVDRGESVRFTLKAVGRPDGQLWLRGKGEAWRRVPVTLDTAGRAERTEGPLAGDLFAFLESGGRTSDTVLVHVRMPAFLGRLTLTATYPAYLRMEDEVLPTGGDTLMLPAGTRLRAQGETTAELASAAWQVGTAVTPLAVDGREFTGTLTPRASGTMELKLATRDGAPIGGDPIRLPIAVVPDLPPEVDVPVPGQDTMPALGADVALVIDVRDDHGVAAVAVSAVRSRGARQVVTTALPVPNQGSDRALLSTKLDLARFDLAPGDTLQYWASARDNSPAGNVGRSKTYVLIMPTASEARAEQKSATKQVGKRIDSLVADSKKLQRQTEDLSREQTRATQGDKAADPSMAFDEAKRAEQVAREQQDLLDKAESLSEQLEKLEQNTDKAGLADSAFRRQLEDIREQLDKALSPEMRKQLEELRQALKNLDPQAAKESLKKLAEMQEKLKEALERTRDLFKRAALEGELSSLEQEAKDVAKQQEDLAEQMGKADSSAVAKQEQQLAERADSVAKGLDQASKQMSQEQKKEALESSANQAKQAAQNMRESAKSAKSGKQREAKQQGKNAAQKMKQVEKDVKEQKESQQQEWKQEVIDAIDRALAETTRLSQRQLNLTNSIGRGTTLAQSRQEQAVIEEGVQKVVEQVLAVSGKNALVPPQIGASLVAARLQMARAREAVSSASANLREAAEQAGEAVDGLNVAAFQMLRARDDVSGSSSGSGMAEAMQKMQQMAGQQGNLSQQGNNLLSMLAGQQMMSQMQALAQKQRQMAQDLERLRAQTQAPGVRDLAEEAKELARKLEGGRIDRETVERQERLFKRMLDAGRTLQGEEKDEKKERESVTAKGDSVSIPGPLRRLLDRSGQIRLPTWEELQRLSPEERRIVTDYFRRLTAKEPQ